MASPNWPAADKRTLIGKRIDRIDGPLKTTGTAKYSYDINRPQMLWAKLVTSPHAKAEVVSVNLDAAAKMPGVKAMWKDDALKDVQYEGQIIGAVAAETEEIATEAARRVQVAYKVLDHQVVDTNPDLSKDKPSQRETGKVDEGFAQSDITISGQYGIPVISHCCLESHGQVTEVKDGELYVWPSTQNVSKYSDRLGEAVDIPQNKIHVDCQHMGGGFGSKFVFDKWGVIGALLSKQSGRPVKLMLDRDLELMIAGNRPSAFAKIKVGAKKDGTVTAVQTEVWGTGGNQGYNAPPVPYVFTKVPNTSITGRGIRTNRGGQRAWRAPNHPQGCYLTMSALADTAAALKMDELDFFMHNAQFTDRAQVYREELKIAADLINYKQKAHLRGQGGGAGPIRRGLGISIHTWGGRGHDSACDVTINPDGSVEAKIGTQDLGVGTRTALAIVIGETLGLPIEAIQINIGKNSYPTSGGSGGSTTIGGISTSSRFAATEALNALLEVASKKLGVGAENLEASGGTIRQTDKPDNKIAWKDACALLGPNPITKRGTCVPGEAVKQKFIDAGVGGAQIADVSVDMETGIVSVNELVAAQDCGLVIDLKTAESQVYGALIMGITYALFEECVYDSKTGRMLNADMEFYRLAGLKDVGQLKVHMMTGQGYDERGVVGLGEPPVISPGAAIANAVANACGVRVPYLPLTPDRVLTALQQQQKGGIA
ncbi:MAG TPA: xanthine dehydrogenase family protein molybdopterin-binding subunit [Verrucomicrobiae bacterium]|nr:xanthine dehydrogenase family protein molybdopterin-binding subunit [Verrucomicrobiae bacterium]